MGLNSQVDLDFHRNLESRVLSLQILRMRIDCAVQPFLARWDLGLLRRKGFRWHRLGKAQADPLRCNLLFVLFICY